MDESITDLVQRHSVIQQQGGNLISDFIKYCERTNTAWGIENARLSKELEDAKLDLDDAFKARRGLQKQLEAAERHLQKQLEAACNTERYLQHQLENARGTEGDLQQQLKNARETEGDLRRELEDARENLQQQLLLAAKSDADCASMRTRNPYIQVLIDGDGMIFNTEYIKKGIEGGRQAATALEDIILQQCGDPTEIKIIMAKVCSNISGLLQSLLQDGCIDNIDTFKGFMTGFTQGKAFFEFVDVGNEKERASSRMKEIIQWHLRNHNCKQILLGISHDASYAPFLDNEVIQDDRCRIAIIEGPPTVHELIATSFQIINFNQLFRAAKLVDKSPTYPAPALPHTWAGITSIRPTHQASPVTNGASIKRSSPAPLPTWIPSPRGLDTAIVVNAAVLDKVKRRTNNNKLCNNHYLRGPCAKGSECCFEHDYKPSEEELKAIAFLTRLNPCVNGQDCELEFCIYGHHCPSTVFSKKDGEWQCSAFGCRFSKEDHPPNTLIKHPRKEPQRIEYYERY